MWFDVLGMLGGLTLLVLGADVLVRSASDLAFRLGVSASVVGLTVVAGGTSFPELVVSLDASWRGLPDIAVGNVVGSNIYNIVLILGLAALIRPLVVGSQTIRFEWPVLFLASAAVVALGQDARLSRLDGSLLVLGLLVFIALLVRDARRAPPAEEQVMRGATDALPWGRGVTVAAALTVGSVLVLGLGARILVSGAVSTAGALGVSERVVGLTLVAVGTSLPELFTSVVAALRKQDDIAVANVVGSNILNVFGILGVSSLVLPLDVSPTILSSDLWWMLGFSALLLPLLWTGLRIARWEGALLLSLGAVYTGLLVSGGA